MVQEQVSNKMMNYLKQLLINASKISSEILAYTFALAQIRIREEMLDRKLKKGGQATQKDFQLLRQRGEKVNYITVAEEDYEIYKKILKHNKVFYMSYELNNNEEIDNQELVGGSTRKEGGKTYQISYINDQRHKVQASTDILMALYSFKNEISIDTFNIYYDGLSSKAVEGLSPEEFEIFKDHAVRTGLIYAMEEKDGKYNIYYGYDQEENAYNAIIGLGLDSTAPGKDKLYEKALASIKNREVLSEAIKGEVETLYAVNTTNPNMYIKLTNLDYTFYKNGTVVRSLNRDEKGFAEEITTKIKDLDDFVVLTQDEFMMPEQMKKEVIKEKNNLYPDGFYDTFTLEKHTLEHREAAINYTNERFDVYTIIPNREVETLDKIVANAKAKQKKYQQKKEQKERKKEERNSYERGQN